MYRVTIQTIGGNENTIFYPGSADYTLVSAVLQLKVGSAGEFDFTLPINHPRYDDIVRNSIVTVYEDGAEIWRGDIRDITQNFDKSLNVYCLEDLAWLGDETVNMTSITTETYLERFTNSLATYNAGQNVKRQFTQGVLTSRTGTDICRWQPEWEMTYLDCLRKFIADDGFVRIRRVTSGGVVTRYLDIVRLEDYGQQASQKIQFGSNLLDFVKDIDTTNFINVLYPYGAETETPLYGEQMARLVGDPIQNDDSIAAFGRRARTVVFETESIANLNRLALAYLNRYSQPNMKLEIKAIDLGNIDAVTRLHLGDSVQIVARPFGIDQWEYVTKQNLDLLNLANNKIELSSTVQVRTSLTSQLAQAAEMIDEQPTATSILSEAKANALKILNGDNGGVIYFVSNSDNQITEQVIANNLDLDQATKAWRWNINGLAYLHRTYATDPWTVGVAITMNGAIVADYITTGTLNANNVRVVGKIEATSGYIGAQYQGWNIGSAAIYNGPNNINDASTYGMYVGVNGIRSNGSYYATCLIKDGQINCNSNVTTGALKASFATCGGLSIQGSSYDISFEPNNSSAPMFQYYHGGAYTGAYVPWSGSSDKRLKENIEPIDNAFVKEFFDKLNPVRFNYIADESKKTEFGLVAQELEEVFEEVDESNNNIVIDIQQYKAIDYQKMVGLLIPAIKDLYAQIDELKEEIKLLKEERNG